MYRADYLLHLEIVEAHLPKILINILIIIAIIHINFFKYYIVTYLLKRLEN